MTEEGVELGVEPVGVGVVLGIDRGNELDVARVGPLGLDDVGCVERA